MRIKLTLIKNISYILPLAFWILLSLIEIISFFFQYPKPMYFRAWEDVVNEGKDAYFLPFKPLTSWSGFRQGDYLGIYRFVAEESDKTFQEFFTDEYGFRNRKNLLENKIDAVIIGTSFVAGASETQKNLVSEILIDKYNIKTYNYAGGSIQHFLADQRFVKQKPKYFIIIAQEAEITPYHWVVTLIDSDDKIDIKKWKSEADWEKLQNPPEFSVNHTFIKTKRFSIVKHLASKGYTNVINFIFPREIVAYLAGPTTAYYDKDTGFIFYNIPGEDPRYTKEKVSELKKTIITLKQTRDILKSRGMHLIVAVMPNKPSLYASQYKNVKAEDHTLVQLEKEMEDSKIEHIKLFDIINNYAKEKKELIYFPGDGHWTSVANQIISEKLALKIKELELNK